MPKYQKRNNNRRRFRKKPVKKTSMYKIAKKANYDMIPRKYRPEDGTFAMNSSTVNSTAVFPYLIPAETYAGSADTDELMKRTGNQIYLERCAGVFNIKPPKEIISPIQVRLVCGWFKGNTTGTPLQGPGVDETLTAQNLYNTFQNRLARYSRANYKIERDSFFTMTPEQIYDSNGSDDSIGAETLHAIWKPRLLKCNFKIHRRMLYTGGKQGEDHEIEADGRFVMGWKPFIFLLVEPEGEYSNWSESAVCNVDYKFTKYFKDVQ